MTAAGFPWIFVALWFVYLVPSPLPWGNALLAARFAAPTSAGILFSMLEAAGMKETWLFRKARVLAIFDDLDTVLLMIPLKIVLVGFKWELSLEMIVVFGLLVLAWVKLHEVQIPCSWNYTILYSVIVAGLCEIVAFASAHDGVPMEAVHLEVLMPAFVIGCITRNPHLENGDPHLNEDPEVPRSLTSFEKNRAQLANASPGALALRRHDEGGDRPYKPVSRESVRVLQEVEEEWNAEETANTVISACFMVLVGLSMPQLFGGDNCDSGGGHRRRMMGGGLASGVARKIMGDEGNILVETLPTNTEGTRYLGDGVEEGEEHLQVGALAFHVVCVSLLMVIGKLFPICCYREEANIR